MNQTLYVSVLVPVLIIIISSFFKSSVFDICEPETCPLCCGDNFCEELRYNTSLNFDNINNLIFNLISVKNVYFGNYKTVNVVIKKFIQTFNSMQNQNPSLQHLRQLILDDELNQLHFCDSGAITLFLDSVERKHLVNLVAIFKVNPEPLLLEIFRRELNWPTPKLFGYCGRCVVVENCGVPLSQIADADWYDRAFVANQLLEAAGNFTSTHLSFRLYLTDISPDNIVVNLENFRITFIDLEHGVLKGKKSAEQSFHHTTHVSDDDYAFSIKDICSKDVSDHNIYSVCRLMLSKDAPYPMMSNGLLHSPPSSLKTHDLFKYIELCVDSNEEMSRFLLSKMIRNIIERLLKDAKYRFYS